MSVHYMHQGNQVCLRMCYIAFESLTKARDGAWGVILCLFHLKYLCGPAGNLLDDDQNQICLNYKSIELVSI